LFDKPDGAKGFALGSDERCSMSISVLCKELGMDCPFETKGENGEVVLDSVMHHIRSEHKEILEDWFGIEEIYHAACEVIRKKAA
jgi:predicted small metal-binding protein